MTPDDCKRHIAFLDELDYKFNYAFHENQRRVNQTASFPYLGMSESLRAHLDSRLAYCGTSLQFI
jgi:hypothetical protein